MMIAPNSIQVLIVGAGPTGLAAAASLAKLGVRVRVLDQNEGRSVQSKALGVQAGTLTCLEKVFGQALPQQMIAAGKPTQEAWVHLHGAKPVRVDLSVIEGQYNYILILPQSETEKFLENEVKKYHVNVERKTTLVSYEASPLGISAVLKLPNGETERVNSDFILGCDGAHSVVRKQSGISFAGSAYDGNFILGDVKINWPWGYDSIRTFIKPKGIIAAFPLGEDQLYRLILIPKLKTTSDPKNEIAFNEFQSLTAEISEQKIKVLSSDWLTRFRVHHRMADSFQAGRVFLAGDAAHIHSPAGGQGMNTGIQDALNLSFKIKKVLTGADSMRSLACYSQERMPVAKAVLRGTDLVFKLALLPENPLVSAVRKYILRHFIQTQWIQKSVVKSISEMKAARAEIARYPIDD